MGVTVTPPPELEEAPESSEVELELELLIKEARARTRRRRLAVAAAALMVVGGIGAILAGGGGGAASLDFDRDSGGRGAAAARAEAGMAASTFALRDLVIDLAFDPRPPATAYLATLAGRVYKSRDAGQHWTMTARVGPSGTRVDALAIDPRRPQRLYAGTGVAVFRSVDGGRSWKAGNRGLFVAPSHDNPRHRALEGWVYHLAFDPSGGAIYAGTASGGVRKSTDSGRSWKTVLMRGRLTFGGRVRVAPSRPSTLYADIRCLRCERDSIYKTTDAARTWRPTAELPNTKGVGAFAVDPRDSTTVYAAGDTAAGNSPVVKTTDGGVHWVPIENGLPAKRWVTALEADPHHAGTVYAVLCRPAWGCPGPGGVFKTTDGGLSWDRLDLGFPIVTALTPDPAHPERVYAAVEVRRQTPTRPNLYGIVKSEDGGRTWSR